MDTILQLRLATVADVPVILGHRRAMCASIGWNDPAALAEMEASCRVFFERALADGSYRGWLVETSTGEVAAGGGLMVYAWPSNPRDPRALRAYIMNMYTEPTYRQRGLAGQIMQAMIAWCRAEGFKWVTLHASEMGRPIYAGLGFEPTVNEMRLSLE